ncbi:MAG: SigB/SigF/SigG family RNA polymerase sigma factor [Clostridiales bacterium]|nr:SigB/SigF/SigG family RNA polymerase sigma factor [Clostridiales bacterium]
MKWETENTLLLIKKAQQKDTKALDYLVKENAPLVKSIIKHYLNRGSDYEDLFQVGNIGLIKAIFGFSSDYDVRFSTYAVPLISGEVKRYIRDNNSVKMPRSLKEMQQKIRYARQKLSLQLNAEPGAIDIAKEIDASVEDVLFALESMQSLKSLDEPVGDEVSLTYKDVIEDKPPKMRIEDKLALYQCINQLDEREKKIILLRYFKDLTQTKTADIMGVSQVQISRIESRAIDKLKRKLG